MKYTQLSIMWYTFGIKVINWQDRTIEQTVSIRRSDDHFWIRPFYHSEEKNQNRESLTKLELLNVNFKFWTL